MKKVLIGGFLSLIGSIWCLVGFFAAAANVQTVTEWSTPPGRFGTSMLECHMVWPVVLGGLLLLLGLAIMGIEYFRKEK